jgi:hypothetical protein
VVTRVIRVVINPTLFISFLYRFWCKSGSPRGLLWVSQISGETKYLGALFHEKFHEAIRDVFHKAFHRVCLEPVHSTIENGHQLVDFFDWN